MREPLHIALMFDYNLSYPRGVLRGIKQYVQSRPDWVLMHLETDRMSVEELRACGPPASSRLVAYRHLAEMLESLREPIVNVANVLPDLPFPRVTTDHRMIGAVAADHFCKRRLSPFRVCRPSPPPVLPRTGGRFPGSARRGRLCPPIFS